MCVRVGGWITRLPLCDVGVILEEPLERALQPRELQTKGKAEVEHDRLLYTHCLLPIFNIRF